MLNEPTLIETGRESNPLQKFHIATDEAISALSENSKQRVVIHYAGTIYVELSNNQSRQTDGNGYETTVAKIAAKIYATADSKIGMILMGIIQNKGVGIIDLDYVGKPKINES